MKTPATPGRPQLPATIGDIPGPNETACTTVSPHERPGADAASAFSVVSCVHCPAAVLTSGARAVGAVSMVPSCSSARVRPDGATAMAPGVLARPASSRPVVQFRPASVLVASGEKTRFWLGRKPTVSEVPPPAATSPPLSATPGGVTSDQRLAPARRTKSCQKLLSEAADPPMTAIAQVPCAVTSEVLSGTVTAGGLASATLTVCVPQPAARPVHIRAKRAKGPKGARPPPLARDPVASRRVTSDPAPDGRTG